MSRRRGLGDVQLVKSHVPGEVVKAVANVVVLMTHMFVGRECRTVAGITGDGRR